MSSLTSTSSFAQPPSARPPGSSQKNHREPCQRSGALLVNRLLLPLAGLLRRNNFIGPGGRRP